MKFHSEILQKLHDKLKLEYDIISFYHRDLSVIDIHHSIGGYKFYELKEYVIEDNDDLINSAIQVIINNIDDDKIIGIHELTNNSIKFSKCISENK